MLWSSAEVFDYKYETTAPEVRRDRNAVRSDRIELDAAPVESLAGRGPPAHGGAGRRPPGAQLPGPGDPGRRRPCGRLARPVPARRGQHGIDDRLRGRPFHGGDGQDPRSGEDRPGPRRRGRMLSRRHDHRRAVTCLEGGALRRRGGLLRQHLRRGEGRDRHLLHVVQRGRGRGVDPRRPRGPVPPRPVPRRPRPAGHRAHRHADLDGRVPRARRHLPHRPAAERRGRPRCRAAGAPRVRLRHQRALDGLRRPATHRAGARPLHRRHARPGPADDGEARPGRHRDRHAPPAAPGQPGHVVRTGQLPRGLPLHEDVDAGEAAPGTARGTRRDHRPPGDRQPGPGGRRGDGRDRHSLTGRRMNGVVAALPLPPAGWSRATDVVVVGSGAAGLMTAVALADAGRSVTVVTKGALGDGSTAWAQGGLAAVLGADDDTETHVQDTLVAGAGLCDEAAVRILVDEAPAAIALLQKLGARLDLDAHGRPALTREGGHSRDRIVHAGGDASGAEVTRTLGGALRARGIDVLENTVALDALRAADGRVVGLRVARIAHDGSLLDAGDLRARATVLATGGYGQVYAATSNPAGATGDGLALALRAGAEVADVEMVQFHPTVLWTGPAAVGQQALISEAVRGEGAVLVDRDGRRIMPGAHPLADLAPRDVVSATIAAHLRATGEHHVWLDATALGGDHLRHRFPGILRACRDAGFDLTREPVPVTPAAHYSCGGVVADLAGRTSVAGLFAVGEVACTGVQGANRLASNSITEGLVAARRCAALLAVDLPAAAEPVPAPPGEAID